MVCSIHQPREQIFETFDQLLVLVSGRTAYVRLQACVRACVRELVRVCVCSRVAARQVLALAHLKISIACMAVPLQVLWTSKRVPGVPRSSAGSTRL